MAFWTIFLAGKRLRLEQYLIFLVVASLPFTGYLLLFAYSKRFPIWSTKPFINYLGVTINASTSNNFTGDKSFGGLTVNTWSDICGTANIDPLRNWPHFPFHPDHLSIQIPEFHNIRNIGNGGERIFGFLHPQRSGRYKFAITSSGPSELWLSPNEDPGTSEMVARVYSPVESASTLEGDYKKYPDQISKEITLDAGKKYYIESLAMYANKQGSGSSHTAVYWRMYSKNTTFEIISSKYLSIFFEDNKSESIIPPHAVMQDSSHQNKVNLYYFHRLPFVSKSEYATLIPTCSYSPSFLVRRKIKRYSGVWMTKESFVFPQDDTNMFNKAEAHERQKWSIPNPLVDKNRVESVVNKFMTTLPSRKYFLKKIHKVIQKPDHINGDRFLLDLELGVNNTNRTFRLTEHVYQKKGSENLCLPEGMNWNNSATVYFIIPVKNQGKWVHHFIRQVTEASLLTGDTNFHVIIADFESKDIEMGKVFNTTLLSSRHTILNLTGKFYKTFALNKAVEAVPNAHDIVFLFDLHIDVPADIMDSVRKNTIANRMAYFPVVGRLNCGSTPPANHLGFWQMNGFGIMAMYKSDWNRLGGMNIDDYKFKWGGEDWDLIDRVLMMTFEVERIKHPGLFHHHHSHRAMWN